MNGTKGGGDLLQKLVILHTNDIHSHFEQMARIAEIIRQRKAACMADACQVIVIDCGDHLDRSRMETEGSRGLANIEVMNATGYDYAVPGNNEGLTFTYEMLEQLYAKADFTVIGSNMRLQDSRRFPPWIEPYVITKRNGLRIALIGLNVPYNRFYHLLGWDLLSPLEVAAHYVKELRDQADVIAVISHLGIKTDEQLAREVPGIDLIFGAHTHHLFERPVRIHNTYLCAAGKFGQYVGEVELTFDKQTGRLAHVDGRCIEVSHADERPDIVELISNHERKCRITLNETVTILDEPLPIKLDQESWLGNMMAAGLRKWTQAEIGLVNAGQMLQGFGKGVVTRADLHRLCPSPVNPCKYWIRGDRLWHALEEALLGEYQQKEIRGFGFRGERLGILCLDGVDIAYVGVREPYRKIESVRIGGQPLDPDREYSVGTIDMFTFGVGYTSIREGRDMQFYMPEFLRDVLYYELRDKQAIQLSKKRHWIEQC